MGVQKSILKQLELSEKYELKHCLLKIYYSIITLKKTHNNNIKSL